ncbi:IS110 family transposase [Nocardia asteroides]|nr:IS110 family transposase [Nocardia asteroides]UAK31986.1 IS110 family transposase [Nocardia asteroides]UAK35172.1 IS110 family transposase [Nocardia asteroides]
MAERPEIWVGIDVGKRSHHACAVDAAGEVVFSQRFGNDQRAIEQLVARSGSAARSVRWAVDLTGPLSLMLLTVLLNAGQAVVYVPGSVVNAMSRGFRGEGKTDARDARVIAETARMRRDLAEVAMPEELVAGLTQLTRYRADLMSDWVAGVNRLRAVLGSIFPVLEAAFDYSNRGPLILVSALCTPSEIMAAGIDGVTTHLSQNGVRPSRVSKLASTAVAVANVQDIAVPGEADAAVLVKRIAGKLLDLDREIKDTDKLIAKRFRAHPWARIIESLPGMGAGLGADFLVETGGSLATFGSAGRLASYAGLVPVPRDSGRVSGNLRRPTRYNRRMRRVFYLAALSSLRVENGPSRQFYDRKRAERRIHPQALMALARRLVDVLWALLRDGREFVLDSPNPVAAAA